MLFQIASTYFVFLIVLLRLVIIYKPMIMMSLERKTTKIFTTLAWVIALVLNFLPIIVTAGYDKTTKPEEKGWNMIAYLIQINVGITLPLSLTIIANVLTSIKLRQKTNDGQSVSGKESKNNENFRKLINGLVVWLIVCNAPYIAWYHWVQGEYIRNGRMWSDIPGVTI